MHGYTRYFSDKWIATIALKIRAKVVTKCRVG